MLSHSPVAASRIVPRRVVPEPATRNAKVSVMGPEIAALAWRKSRLPTVSSMCSSGWKVGWLVTMLIAPAVVFLPYSVPWGPRRTSTRLTSNRSFTALATRL